MKFDRKIYFDSVRAKPFGKGLTQEQVDGQNAILDAWETNQLSDDLRHLAYMLATAYHETAQRMWPIEEYGAPTCGGAEYAKEDPQTEQRYYGRGFVQLTWRDNYARATNELNLTGSNDLEKNAARALNLDIASAVMFRGMWEGWFRSGHTLPRYFNDDVDDPYAAREIVNGDKHIVPEWSGGKSIGRLIVGYHNDFLAALEKSLIKEEPEPAPAGLVSLAIETSPDVELRIIVNGIEVEL